MKRKDETLGSPAPHEAIPLRKFAALGSDQISFRPIEMRPASRGNIAFFVCFEEPALFQLRADRVDRNLQDA